MRNPLSNLGEREWAGKAGAMGSGHGVHVVAYTSLASSVISVLLAKSFEIGHPALASAAALAKTSGVAPGTLAVAVSAMRVTAKPPSTLPSETAAWVSIFVGVSPAPPNCAPSAMEKQPAWAAAINSSGVVPVAAPSKRVPNE